MKQHKTGIMVSTLVLLSLFILYVTSYKLRCPAPSEWHLTAKAMCGVAEKYHCLYDEIHGYYVEGCDGPDFDRKGSKRVKSGSFTRGSCQNDRYQPFKFWTNGSSDCVYQKSFCNEEGQIIYRNGSSTTDTLCRCDFTSGYAFVVTPRNLSYCNVSAYEDCSCYVKTCAEGNILSADYECVDNSNKPTSSPGIITRVPVAEPGKPILPNASHVSRTEEMSKFNRKNRSNAIIYTAVALGLMIGSALLTLGLRKWINRYVDLCNKQIIQPLQKHKFCATDNSHDDGNGHDPLLTQFNPDDSDNNIASAKSGNSHDDGDGQGPLLTQFNLDDSDNIDSAKSGNSHDDDNGYGPHPSQSNPDDSANIASAKSGQSQEKIDKNCKRPESTHSGSDSSDGSITPQRGRVEDTEVYFLRIIHLLFSLACPVLRMKFDQEVHPDNLSSQLQIPVHQSQLLKKMKHKQYYKDTVFPVKNKTKVTSADFDIKIMVMVLNNLAQKNIGTVMPRDNNTNEVSNLERIYCCRNSIEDILNGQLSFKSFALYWDNISQAILRLTISELHSIEGTSKDLFGRIIDLNPVDFNHKELHKFVQLVDWYSSKIFAEIIKEFCTMQNSTVEELFKQHKHTLFHKRRKTKSCCRCKHNKFAKFQRCLAEKEWNTIYIRSNTRTSHNSKCTGDPSKCCEHFDLQPRFKLESCHWSFCTSIILNLPTLLKFTLKKICSSKGFQHFLENHKHGLYHAAMSRKCCKCYQEPICEIVVDKDELNTLYEESSPCENIVCSCKYKARKEIKIEEIDDSLLSRVASIVGPISRIKNIEDDVFKHFCVDENLDLHYECHDIKNILDRLLDTITDDNFRKDMKNTMSEFWANTSAGESEIENAVQTWAYTKLEDRQPLEIQGMQRPILVRSRDGFKLFEVQTTVSYNHSRRREPKNVTKSENYFLRVFHLLIKVAYPAVKFTFDKEFPPQKLSNTLQEWYSEQEIHTEDNKNGKNQRLYLTQRQRKIVFDRECSSEKFDIHLMGYLLRKLMAKKKEGVKSIVIDLQRLLAIDDKIIHSCNGRLTQEEFDSYWKDIKEISIRLGDGEKSKQNCTKLEKINNIL